MSGLPRFGFTVNFRIYSVEQLTSQINKIKICARSSVGGSI